jgi:hypothetical protein
MECREVQRLLWTGEPDGGAAAHVDTCPLCRAEAKRFEQLRRVLGGLQHDLATPPADLESALLTLAGRTRLRNLREAVLHNPRVWQGAAAAAAAAAAVSVLVARRRLARPELVA